MPGGDDSYDGTPHETGQSEDEDSEPEDEARQFEGDDSGSEEEDSESEDEDSEAEDDDVTFDDGSLSATGTATSVFGKDRKAIEFNPRYYATEVYAKSLPKRVMPLNLEKGDNGLSVRDHSRTDEIVNYYLEEQYHLCGYGWNAGNLDNDMFHAYSDNGYQIKALAACKDKIKEQLETACRLASA